MLLTKPLGYNLNQRPLYLRFPCAFLALYYRRIVPKDSWARCVHVTGGRVVFASCSVACLAGVGLLAEGPRAHVQVLSFLALLVHE